MEIIAGVDEAGRGPLAGPVVACAVILPPDHSLKGLKDSKKLSARKRAFLVPRIIENAVAVATGIISAREIDKINILEATQKAMRLALGNLKPAPVSALIDGFPLPHCSIPNRGIIKGDTKIESIMAASIVAKQTRDRIMEIYDLIFPEYGFIKHKGYGTKEHMQALKFFKACPIHRKSFRPVEANFPSLTWLAKQSRIGKLGEQLTALNYLKRGYEIKALNQVCGFNGEIDIIAKKEETLVFVEVKSTYKPGSLAPELKVNRNKLKKLTNAILFYTSNNKHKGDIRLDMMTVEFGHGRHVFKNFKGLSLDQV
ncbi:MAG: ribonuclease HII [Candidatus Neomarinimicrobiota bacterium]